MVVPKPVVGAVVVIVEIGVDNPDFEHQWQQGDKPDNVVDIVETDVDKPDFEQLWHWA